MICLGKKFLIIPVRYFLKPASVSQNVDIPVNLHQPAILRFMEGGFIRSVSLHWEDMDNLDFELWAFCVFVVKFETFVCCSVQYCSRHADWS